MGWEILKRILLAVPTLLGTTLVTFLVLQAAPGDPARLAAGVPQAGVDSARVEARIRAFMGLDRPPARRYLDWVARAATLDFGPALDGEPVKDKILRALPATLILGVASFLVGLLAAVPLGTLMAHRAGGFLDRLFTNLLLLPYSTPSWLAGLVLILLLGGVLPFQGWRSEGWESLPFLQAILDVARHSLLILLAVVLPGLAHDALFVRRAVLEELGKGYVQAARALGLPERRVLWGHAFRNALIPVLTLVGVSLPGILAGSVILEQLFSWPGIGRLFFQALQGRDYPVIMAVTTLSAFLVVAGNLLADALCVLADPRLRRG